MGDLTFGFGGYCFAYFDSSADISVDPANGSPAGIRPSGGTVHIEFFRLTGANWT